MSNLNLHKHKLFLLAALLFFGLEGFTQIAIIDDPDGYTNVRSEPNAKAEIIHVLKENELFFYEQALMNEIEWIEVYIPRNKFLEHEAYYLYSNNIIGYIHKSRILELANLNSYNSENFTFKYNLIPFRKEGKIIDYYKDSQMITAINGRKVFGVDGRIPKIETTSIDVFLNDKRIVIPNVLFENLYECTNDFEINVKDDCYFVSQWNSDGAGGYFVVWVINETGLLQRLIFIP